MASLSNRIQRQIEERFQFLSNKGPLSIYKNFSARELYTDLDLNDTLEGYEMTPQAPQLSCDFYMKFNLTEPDGSVAMDTAMFLELWDSKNWTLIDTQLNPSKLNWGYHGQIIGHPVPSVSGDICRLTMAFPSSWETVNGGLGMSYDDYMTAVLALYELQFSRSTGLLKLPRGRSINLQVGLEVRNVEVSLNEWYSRVPLFQLTGIRMSTPRFAFDNNSVNPMGITIEFAYSQTKWANLGETYKKIEQLELPDITLVGGQFENR